MKIIHVTFTGADDKTDLEQMKALSTEFPFIEWGILLSKSQMGKGRYPSMDTILNMSYPLKNTDVAIHVCGSLCEEIVEDGGIKGEDVMLLHNAFTMANRVQLNFSIKSVKVDLLNLIWFINKFDKKFILQQNKNNAPFINAIAPFITRSSKIQILFDASGGRGTVIEDIQEPIFNLRCGYAGGLAPDNILAKIKELEPIVGDKEIWIDMESSVRTNDIFDLKKVRQVCEIIKPYFV